MRKTQKEYNDKFKTIRIRTADYEELQKISDLSQVPFVGLIHIALPMLKKKYHQEVGMKGNDRV